MPSPPKRKKSVVSSSPLYEETRDRYLEILSPLFFPSDPLKHDIIRFFASLLRVVGIEDKGWDPYAESRAILEDLNALMQLKLPRRKFPDELTVWRLGLTLYNHIVEMSAPYEVLANLLRFKLEEGYSPNPFYKYMSNDQKKRFKKSGLFPRQKIEIIRNLSVKSGIRVNEIFDDFVRFDLRNAIAHADFIIADDMFRCRGSSPSSSFSISLVELDRLLTAAKAFISAFFVLEREARKTWGAFGGRAIPYDPVYKGLMEVLSDEEGYLNGFKVHWPNHEESFYRRTPEGIDMVNCFLDLKSENIQLFVGMYARRRDAFSPLVELGGKPRYTPVEGSEEAPVWDYDAAAATQKPLPPVRIAFGKK